jgi:hypothetical protein
MTKVRIGPNCGSIGLAQEALVGLPARTGPGVPNFLFPESCAAVLARAAERREWLSQPLGPPPHYPDLDGGSTR